MAPNKRALFHHCEKKGFLFVSGGELSLFCCFGVSGPLTALFCFGCWLFSRCFLFRFPLRLLFAFCCGPVFRCFALISSRWAAARVGSSLELRLKLRARRDGRSQCARFAHWFRFKWVASVCSHLLAFFAVHFRHWLVVPGCELVARRNRIGLNRTQFGVLIKSQLVPFGSSEPRLVLPKIIQLCGVLCGSRVVARAAQSGR